MLGFFLLFHGSVFFINLELFCINVYIFLVIISAVSPAIIDFSCSRLVVIPDYTVRILRSFLLLLAVFNVLSQVDVGRIRINVSSMLGQCRIKSCQVGAKSDQIKSTLSQVGLMSCQC